MYDLIGILVACIPTLFFIWCMRGLEKKDNKTPFSGDIVIKIEHVSENSDEQSPCQQSGSAPPSPSSSPTGKEGSSPD